MGILEQSFDESLDRRFLYRTMIERTGNQANEMAVCADDPVHWINYYGFTFDPRDQRKWPFDLFPKQAEFIRWLQEREKNQEPGIVAKSRDMGATWMCCAYALHGWLFRKNFTVGFGSRKLELVDQKDDIDSILEKIRFMFRLLPDWMKPQGWNRERHDHVGRIINPNGNSITGEGGDQIGRGGRKSLFVLDEAAFLQHPHLIDRALSETTNVRIDVSTPFGMGNPFAQKWFSGTIEKFMLLWSDDPRKGPEWFAKRQATMDPVTLAQEVLCDFSASIEGTMIPAAWVRSAVGLKLPRGGRRVAGGDVAEYGRDKSVWIDRDGPVIDLIESWGQCNTTQTAYRFKELALKRGVKVLCYDVIGMGAALRGTYESSLDPMAFIAAPINTGEKPSETYWEDGRTSREKFTNQRAELWFKVRNRFEKAFEYVTLGIEHPVEEMISIPNHGQLIAELSLPQRQFVENGKIRLEAKESMRARGIPSPNFADALVLSFADQGYGEWNDPIPDKAFKVTARPPKGVFNDDDGGDWKGRRDW